MSLAKNQYLFILKPKNKFLGSSYNNNKKPFEWEGFEPFLFLRPWYKLKLYHILVQVSHTMVSFYYINDGLLTILKILTSLQ